jgi:hypothetical protein
MKANANLALVQDTQPTDAPQTRPLNWADIEKLLDRPIAFQRPLATIGGGALGGLFLSQALYWSKRATLPDGWFHKTQQEWEEETALTRTEQETVRRNLKARGLMKEKRTGLPARLHFQVQQLEVLHALEKLFAENPQSSLRKTRNQESPKPADKKAGNPQTLSTEITSQTTSQITSSTDNPNDDVSELLEKLIEAGATPFRVRKLAPLHSAELRRRLEILPHLENVGNAGALLLSHLDKAWEIPPKLKRKNDAEMREAAAALEARQAQKQQAEKDARDARQQALDDQLDAHFKSLDDEDRADIDAKARRRMQTVFGEKRETPAQLAIARRQVMAREMGFALEENDD